MVLVIVAITMTIGAYTFTNYLERTSARQAAELFGRDLTLARTTAVRARRKVVLRFEERSLAYRIYVLGGDTLTYRRFDDQGDVRLSEMNLETTGDSLVFDRRGLADLSGVTGPLGRALFRAGGTTYAVQFNSMGASRVDEQ